MLIVKAVVAIAPFGFTEAGWNWHVAIAGSPEQLKDTEVLKLGTAMTEIENVADCPGDTVALLGEDDIANGAAFAPTIWVRVSEVLGAKSESPL